MPVGGRSPSIDLLIEGLCVRVASLSEGVIVGATVDAIDIVLWLFGSPVIEEAMLIVLV